ncbi:hypothetical protein SAMN04489835_0369 [Mycolicibacterium rutilum]|uniref:Uncharacterized protein n=1 Tax=Mycolicibacterium rutilum TaxID=370526 RepID=A0A1H6IQK0_MYCRU|nr:hypothetical protein SAMN04489835_0369 [Mycolicibacterium rutilum]
MSTEMIIRLVIVGLVAAALVVGFALDEKTYRD